MLKLILQLPGDNSLMQAFSGHGIPDGIVIVKVHKCKLEWCEREPLFVPKRSDHDFCSEDCRREYWNKSRE